MKYYRSYDYTDDYLSNMTDLLSSLYVDKLNLSNVEGYSLVDFLMVVPKVLWSFCFLVTLSNYSLLVLLVIELFYHIIIIYIFILHYLISTIYKVF